MKILDSTGKFELAVGMLTTDERVITAIFPAGDEEGSGPVVVVSGERWFCDPLDYRHEGPDFPENWTCAEAEILTKILPSTHECGYFRRLASVERSVERSGWLRVEYGRHLAPEAV